MDICVTGYGIVSALGIGKEATLHSLMDGKRGIGAVRYLKTTHSEFPVGEVPLSNEEMMHLLHISPSTPTTRTALMGMLALGEALSDAGLSGCEIEETGLVSGTTVGGMDQSEQHYLDFLDGDDFNHYIRTHDCGATTAMIAAHYGNFKFMTTVSTACSSAANAIIMGANLIRCGHAQCVVVGGSESLTKFHLCGFNALMILDQEPCRPFDSSRHGLNLGEGAAFLVLESSHHAAKRHATTYATLAGYGNACDAYHQTASSPDGEGAYRAMRMAIEMAGITPERIDYINAHGTATPNNDSSESQAMRRIWSQLPPVSSTKSATGHTTSASGSIEAAICLLAMQHRFVPQNIGFATPDPQCIVPQASLKTDTDLHYVLSNSFGFGGNDSSVIFSDMREHTTVATGLTGAAAIQPLIYAASQISAQTDDWFDHPAPLTEPYQRAVDPDFKQHIPPLEARRMGRLLKRAVVTTKRVLQTARSFSTQSEKTTTPVAPFDTPDAIITGTGLGCIENTELFLDALCREGEQGLKPTHFMQSTHNTIGSLAAINLQCHGYNSTYAHQQLSFDSALLDACLQMQLGMISTAIVGAHDEMTPSYYRLLCKAGYLGLPGQKAAEAAIAFAIGTQESDNALCRIAGIRICHNPVDATLRQALCLMLQQAHIDETDISAIMTAQNCAEAHDRQAIRYAQAIAPQAPRLKCRHLFGESYAASAAALYASATCLSRGLIPSHLLTDNSETINNPKAIIIHNYTDTNTHSLILIVKNKNKIQQ